MIFWDIGYLIIYILFGNQYRSYLFYTMIDIKLNL